MKKGKLIIVSNRLPVKIEASEEKVKISQSSGGLISAILSYMESIGGRDREKAVWVGFPDCDESCWNKAIGKLVKSDFEYKPVFLPDDQYNGYYNGFSNSTLWPLFHYFPSFTEYNPSDFDHYQLVNKRFCEVLQQMVQPEDTVWIHDYHLMLLPSMLRQELGGDPAIGFFLHIPFPSFEIYRLLPAAWRAKILSGIMDSDLIGFHTKDYATYFSNSVQRILGLTIDNNLIKNEKQISKIDYYPISIDFHKFNSGFMKKGVAKLRKEMKDRFGERKIIFSVDRLDYTKGISNRLQAFRLFLEQNPEYREKVVFILNIVPSRDAIFKYSERKKMIDEYVGTLNSDFGNIHWQPVLYQYRSLDFNHLLAFYTVCDLALITPVRDGMNLVAKEFVASRQSEDGVLVLSEMAGSAIELDDALLINPTDVEHSARQIKVGLEMSAEEQKERMRSMRNKIKEYDVVKWASDFLGDLAAIKERQKVFQTRYLTPALKSTMAKEYANSHSRLILLDYDGTLVPYFKNPLHALPGPELIRILGSLAADPKNQVFIISGRKSEQLDQWLGKIPLGMVAEHGAKIKRARMSEWDSQPDFDSEIRQTAIKVMQRATSRCPASHIEEKEYSLVWHYRSSSPELGRIRAAELLLELNETFPGNGSYKAFPGNKIVEFKNSDIHKGKMVMDLLHTGQNDFILCIGDDVTDEDMFRALSQTEAWTLKVGNEFSLSRYNIPAPSDVIGLLDQLVGISIGDKM